MLTSCFRLLTRVARQPATFCSEFSASQRFVRIFHQLSGVSTTEFTTMSDNEEWEEVQSSGNSKKKRKGNDTSPPKPKKEKPKGNDKRPQTTNGTASKTAKEGSVVTPKDKKTDKAVESPAKDESCPWLNVVPSDESDHGAKHTSKTETNTPEKKKKNKKKKHKNKNKEEPEHDAKTPKGDSAETTSPQVTNGVKPDADKTTAPKSRETKSEPQEATGEESTKTTTAKSSESTKPDDDGTPMNWEDNVVEQDEASEDKSHAAVADEKESSASQATAAEEANKANIPTDNSAGEGSTSKTNIHSAEREKVKFKVKSQSNDRLQTGSPERNRQGSTGQKDFSKTPGTNHADAKAKKHTSTRDSSHKGRSDPKENERQGSADRSRSGSADRSRSGSAHRSRSGSADRSRPGSNKTPRSGSGDRKESDSTAGSQQGHWKPKRIKPDGTGQGGKKGGQGATGGWPVEKNMMQPRIDCQPIVGFELIEIKGDLFQCADDDAMAHCVSQDLEMGKGIAVYFKKYFGKVGKLRAQEKKVGEVAVLPVGASYVYYMITKERFNHKPTYKTLQSSMVAMRDHCMQNNVTSLAMPQIGCGLDKLNWGVVTEIIKEVFKNTGITVKIYIYHG